jgi:hypothetical protein
MTTKVCLFGVSTSGPVWLQLPHGGRAQSAAAGFADGDWLLKENPAPGCVRHGRFVVVWPHRRPGGPSTVVRYKTSPCGAGRATDRFTLRGERFGEPYCSPSGDAVAFAASVGRKRWIFVHDWVTRTTVHAAEVPAPTHNGPGEEGLACLDGGAVFVRPAPAAGRADWRLVTPGRPAVDVGDYDDVITVRGGAYGVRVHEGSGGFGLTLTPVACDGLPALHFSIDCHCAFNTWHSYPFLPTFELGGLLVSSDDGAWFALKVWETGKKRWTGGVAVWRRGLEMPCFFTTGNLPQSFVLLGLSRRQVRAPGRAGSCCSNGGP